MKTLLTKEKKQVFAKLTPHVSNIIKELYAGKWMQKDICDKTGAEPNRISELVHFYNYQGKPVLNDVVFKKLLEGGIVKIETLVKKAKLTPAEEAFVESYRINQLIAEIREGGFNPTVMLQDSWEKAKKEVKK